MNWDEQVRQLRNKEQVYWKCRDFISSINILVWMCTGVWFLFAFIIPEMFAYVLIPLFINILLHLMIKMLKTKEEKLQVERLRIVNENK